MRGTASFAVPFYTLLHAAQEEYMERFAATFHTHLSALLSSRNLAGAGIRARLAPVPRSLSSSCGTCVLYEAGEPCLPLMDEDVERVYREADEGYVLLYDNQ